MLLLEGIPISPGYATGTDVVYDYEIERRLKLPHRAISYSEIESECTRIDDALEQSSEDLKLMEQAALKEPRRVDTAALPNAATSAGNPPTIAVDQGESQSMLAGWVQYAMLKW